VDYWNIREYGVLELLSKVESFR